MWISMRSVANRACNETDDIEDEIKGGEAEVQKLTDSYIVKVDKLVETKEKDIMTV